MITIGIPAYKAQKTIYKTISSINSSSISDEVEVIIANDNTDDNYNEIIKCFPNLKIKELKTNKNTGPGLARQRCLDECKTEFITFIDADDVFEPYGLELLKNGFFNNNIVVTQGAFLTPLKNKPAITPNGPDSNNIIPIQFIPRNDLNHPWVFGRMYRVDFLKSQKISFSKLRAMEDGEFNAKIRMIIDGTQLGWNIIDQPVYYWNEGSEHSITRTHTKDKDIPIYNYGLCQLGADICYKNALEFVNKKNPFSPAITRTAAELMVGHYFTYYECLQNYSEFAEQNWFMSKWFYNNVFTKYANNVSNDILEEIYMHMWMAKANEFKKFPEMTWNQFFEKIKGEEFKKEELIEIRNKLPEEIVSLEKETGVLNSLDELEL